MLRRSVRWAYQRVPFYRRLFDRANLELRDIRTAEDLWKLPLTSKRDIKERPLEEVLASGFDRRRLIKTTTTGSTGEPMTLWRAPSDELLYFALRWRVMRALGLRPSDLMARISVRGFEGMPMSWRLLQGAGIYRTRPIHILESPEEIGRVVRERRPDVLTGDSGVVARVSREFEGTGSNDHSLRFLVTGSEVLTPNMREDIRKAFGRPVYDTYAAEEFSVLAWECRETGLYHVADDSVILEVLRDGRPVGPGETGETVVTGLLFRAMPLIRYRLGDQVRRGPEPCPCGAPFSTLETITGRMTDYLILPGGREIYAASMAYVFHKRVDWIRQYEMEQEKEDWVVLKAVPKGQPSKPEVDSLENDIADLLGPGVGFRLEFVPELERGPGGKYRILRSKIRSYYDQS
ncbi:MAG: hypothetical protein MUP19_04915 [Candidatus Aminicenantes bacterium]|nr:hypothetical protein [Candidatus Aminicenantes bacterium]